MKRILVLACLLASGMPALACLNCGGSSPWQQAEGPAGMKLGRLRRVYSSSKYNQPVKVEMRESTSSAAPKSGEPIPPRKAQPALPKPASTSKPK